MTRALHISNDDGDDARVFSLSAGKDITVAATAFVEGMHFQSTDAPALLAKLALRTSLASLSVQGAHPFAYLYTLCLPSSFDDTWHEAFLAELTKEATQFGVKPITQNLIRTPRCFNVNLVTFGHGAHDCFLKPQGAVPGDRLYISGRLGSPNSMPRLRLGVALIDQAHAAVQVEHGLMQDLLPLCTPQNLTAYIKLDQIPLDPVFEATLDGLAPEARTQMILDALTTRNSYEIIFSASPGKSESIQYIADSCDVPLTPIGHLTSPASIGSEPVVILTDTRSIT